MRTSLRLLVLASAVTGLLGAGFVGSASGGGGSVGRLVVNKAVEGTQPEGTQFTIRFSCLLGNDPIPEINQVVIDGPGNAVDAIFTSGDLPATCTVSEPEAGGASNVTFACEETEASSCEADNRVTFPGSDQSIGTITVTNSFVEPPPPAPEPVAEAIVTEPAFTG